METRQSHTKEWNWTYYLIPYTKSTKNGFKNLTIKPETKKCLEGNIGGKVLDIGLVIFLTWLQKQSQHKQNQMKLYQTEKLYSQRNLQNEKETYRMG